MEGQRLKSELQQERRGVWYNFGGLNQTRKKWEREWRQSGGTSVYTYLLVAVIWDKSQLYLEALEKLFIYIHDSQAY